MNRATAVAGIASLAAAPAQAQTRPTIVIGATPTDDATPALYAVKAGLFERAGLNVIVQKSPNGAAGTAAVVGGTYQFADTNVLTVVTGKRKGVPIELAAPCIIYNSTVEWAAGVTRPDVTIASGKDLNGRVVGVASVGDQNALALMSWIDQHGGDMKSVRVVEVPYAVTAAALEQGRIDAGVLLQPFLSAGVSSGKIKIFAKVFDAIAPRFQMTAWVTNATWAAANPEVVRKFAQVIRQAELYANAHRDETAPLVAEFAGLDVQQVLKGQRATYAGNISDPRELQPLINAAAKYGVIDASFNAAELISPALR
jgi:NitT/TauT family transport system substrate-binding protein